MSLLCALGFTGHEPNFGERLLGQTTYNGIFSKALTDPCPQSLANTATAAIPFAVLIHMNKSISICIHTYIYLYTDIYLVSLMVPPRFGKPAPVD